MNDEREQQMIHTTVPIQFKSKADMAREMAAVWRPLTHDSHDHLRTDNNLPTMSGPALLRKLRVIRLAQPFILATGVMPRDEDSPRNSGGRKPPFQPSPGPVRHCQDQWQKRGAC